MTRPADYADLLPAKLPSPVVRPGEFVFAASHLDHPHIHGQCDGLTGAGATLKWVYDPDPKKAAAFAVKYPGARPVDTFARILDDAEVALVASAAIPNLRGALGMEVMNAGKDYFTAKTPFTELDQLVQAKLAVARTGRKYAVYYSERLHAESAMYATTLVASGALGRVLQVLGLGPHRLNKASRPAWFFDRARYGGILCDIGSHQFEQFLTFSGATEACVTHALVANHANPDHPGLEDFGEAGLLGNNGATNYVRVDWFTPDGLPVSGDSRTVILGERGYVELRKGIDLARDPHGEQVYIVDESGEHRLSVRGRVGFRFFGELILDCLHRTEHAMSQRHTFKAAELALLAQAAARRIGHGAGDARHPATENSPVAALRKSVLSSL